jgi:pilus assembly protein CpaF
VIRLESRPPNVEGKGQVTIRDLVRNSLRMRPDRIVVGEVRGGESLDMLQAMSTGHDGSLATVHANSAEDALMRLQTLASMSDVEIPFVALHDQINSAVDVIVQLTRFADGARRITEIALMDSHGSDPYRLVTVARFDAQPMTSDGRIHGAFEYHPLPRRTADRLYMASQPLPQAFGIARSADQLATREAR